MAVPIDQRDTRSQVFNNYTIAGPFILQSPLDDVVNYRFWGFSLFVSQPVMIWLEYAFRAADIITPPCNWRLFKVKNLDALTPYDEMFRVTRDWYRITVICDIQTDVVIDLQTIKGD